MNTENNENTEHDPLIRRLENPQEAKKRYESQQKYYLTRMYCLFVALSVSSMGQLLILEYSFNKRFKIEEDTAELFNIFPIPLNFILSLLVTAALPMVAFIDESGILHKKLKVQIRGLSFSPIIWLILPGDMLLTLQAVQSLVPRTAKGWDRFYAELVAVILAIIFSVTALYVSKAIVASFKSARLALKNIYTLNEFGIDLNPLIKDSEQIKLIQEASRAKKETEQLKAHFSKLRKRDGKRIQSLEASVEFYRSQADNLNQLRSQFNQIKKPISELLGHGKEIFGKFSDLDKSVKDFIFPRFDINTPNGDSNISPEEDSTPIYYPRRTNSNFSWKDLGPPAELSPVGRMLLSLIEHTDDIPIPTKVYDEAPREGLSKCLVLVFEGYRLIVYCRDEKYRKINNEWTIQDQMNWKRNIIESQGRGYCVLEFMPEEIMSAPSEVLNRIRDAVSEEFDMEID